MKVCYSEYGRVGIGLIARKIGSMEKLYSYTIITTEANSQLRFLHERMPVILNPG
jgi:putative SOS response-associated peptidase YedK